VYAFTSDTQAPASLDHNLYYSDAGAAGSTWVWQGSEYTTIAAYRTAAAQESHSTFANPLIADLVSPDLRTTNGSPAIDAGLDYGTLVSGASDFAGNPRVVGAAIDIGAYEESF
jgi:hypothetical protein